MFYFCEFVFINFHLNDQTIVVDSDTLLSISRLRVWLSKQTTFEYSNSLRGISVYDNKYGPSPISSRFMFCSHYYPELNPNCPQSRHELFIISNIGFSETKLAKYCFPAPKYE